MNYTHFYKGQNIIRVFILNLILLIIVSCTGFSANNDSSTTNQNTSNPDTNALFSYKIEESVSYKNLQIFPIIDENAVSDINYITLSEAIDKKIVTIIETGNVNELSITNTSNNYIFIMAGDIVKGGKQDRTMGEDYIIPPYIKNAPVKSFCVESGRWSPRGREESDKFSSNSKALSSKDLKLAARKEKNQSSVWSSVSDQQSNLNENLEKETGNKVEVRSDESSTSLQLALENEELNKLSEEYRKALKSIDGFSDKMTGYVYAINGEIYGADIFGNTLLFNEVKDKLIDATIVEAISKLDEFNNNKPVAKDEVEAFLDNAEKGKVKKDEVNSVTDVKTVESDEIIQFETTDKKNNEQMIRKSYIVK